MNINQRIKEARQRAGISLTGLSEKTGVSRSSLQRYEKGATGKIPLSAVSAIEKSLNLPSGYLMGWEEASTPNKEKMTLTENQKEIVSIFGKLTVEKQIKVIGYAEAQLNDDDNVYYIGYTAAMGGERTKTIHTKEELVSAHDKLRARLKKKKTEV